MAETMEGKGRTHRGFTKPGFKSLLCHKLPLKLWARHFVFLCLSSSLVLWEIHTMIKHKANIWEKEKVKPVLQCLCWEPTIYWLLLPCPKLFLWAFIREGKQWR